LDHANCKPARFWIPLLGLFTGLRVAEASQLRPDDFELINDIWCVRVTGDAVGQSLDANSQRLKTLASRRWIPLHPKLIELGLLDYVMDRQKTKKLWMWDGLRWNSKSGFGKYPSRDFHEWATAVGVHQHRRKVFHSFRSTIAQELERCGLEGELIDRFLGHEVKTTRNQSYSRTDAGRAFPVRRVFETLQLVHFPIELDASRLACFRTSKPRPREV
jgi:integrase